MAISQNITHLLTRARAWGSLSRATALALTLAGTMPSTAPAQASKSDAAKKSEPADRRWAPIRKVFGQEGKVDDGYLHLNFPRSDLHVRVGNDALEPDFEFVAFFGFVPVGATNVMAMGELILREEEVPAVLTEARTQGIHITALHNHLLGETPRILFTHFTLEGSPDVVANKLHALIARTATPLGKAAEEPSTANWSAIDAILGKHEEASGAVVSYGFKRKEHLTVGGHAVKSSGAIETASEAKFQQLAPGRVASTGELYLKPDEVEPTVSALNKNGLHVTALHMHMNGDAPARFWVHWYSTGDGPTLARGVAAVLTKMNGDQKSGGKD